VGALRGAARRPSSWHSPYTHTCFAMPDETLGANLGTCCAAESQNRSDRCTAREQGALKSLHWSYTVRVSRRASVFTPTSGEDSTQRFASHDEPTLGELMKRPLLSALVLTTLTLTPVTRAAEWMGHLAMLKHAQIACRDANSRDCLPYLAEAVAVADVLTATTRVSSSKGETTITAVFRNGSEVHCSKNWIRSALNGQRLMQAALHMDARQHAYWVDALLAAAQDHCRS
jgi:hypothetical protein